MGSVGPKGLPWGKAAYPNLPYWSTISPTPLLPLMQQPRDTLTEAVPACSSQPGKFIR
jgi:hypothetical protein